MLRDDGHRVVPEERWTTGHHLVEGRSEGIQVASCIGTLSQCLFRRHVRRRPDHHPLLGQARPVEGESQTEISEPRRAVFRQVDVAWLEVPVDHAPRVCVFESTADLLGKGDGLLEEGAACPRPLEVDP